MEKTCIIIVGPTAVGKTTLAIRLAQHFSTEIISCDSRQCYRELNIGVAKPSAEELQLVTHHFINSHSIHETVNAATFEKYAFEKANAIFEQHDVAVMVGGTGLYVKAFCEGIDDIPEVDAAIRQTVITNYNNYGIAWLQEQVQKNDQQYFATGEIQNPQRMMRALEVKLATGQSILDFYSRQKKTRDFNIIKIGLRLPREVLISRINQRVDHMMQDDLLEEVNTLIPFQELNALQTVGYRELFSYFNNETNLASAVEAIKTNTRQYAKRQMTWFTKDKAISWCAPELDAVVGLLK